MSRNFQFMLAPEGTYEAGLLRQGDVLERTTELSSAIGQAHQYYAEADGYNHFLVLTPTCDLVIRQGRCNARYITLAAVRPLDVLVDREFKKFNQSVNLPGTFLVLERRANAEQFIARLLHNTENGYLFLPGEFFADNIDRCGFLLLSIALRNEHYEACLSSKRLQLSDVFAAQVGNLTSDLYGQIATPALEEQADINVEEILQSFFDKYLESADRYWLSKEQVRELKKRAADWKKANGNVDMPPEVVRQIAASLPTNLDMIVANADRIAREVAVPIDGTTGHTIDLTQFAKALSSDVAVRRLVRG